MKRIEFYRNPQGQVNLQYDSGESHTMRESDREFIERVLDILDTFYPKALAGLDKWFAASRPNSRYFDFLRVRQFILCNFGEFDSYIDLDEFDNFHFEFVQCTIRATCLYNGYTNGNERNDLAVCNPEVNSILSDAELRVLRPIYENINISREEVAQLNYITINTVNNHIKSMLRKLGLKSQVQLLNYARVNNLFK